MGRGDGIVEIESEVGGHEVDHGDEVFDGTEAPGFVLHGLDGAVVRFGRTVGDAGR